MQTITRPTGFMGYRPAFQSFALGRIHMGQDIVSEMEKAMSILLHEGRQIFVGGALDEFQEEYQKCRDRMDAILYEDADTVPWKECFDALSKKVREMKDFLARGDVEPIKKTEARTKRENVRITEPGIPSWVWWTGGGAVALAALYAVLK